jgi:hypothetical protein
MTQKTLLVSTVLAAIILIVNALPLNKNDTQSMILEKTPIEFYSGAGGSDAAPLEREAKDDIDAAEAALVLMPESFNADSVGYDEEEEKIHENRHRQKRQLSKVMSKAAVYYFGGGFLGLLPIQPANAPTLVS